MQMSKWLSLSPLLFAAACVVPQARYDRLQTEYHAENQARRQLEDEVQRKDGEVSDLRSKMNEKDSTLTELQKTSEDDKARIAQLEKALKDAQKPFVDGAGAESDGVSVFRTSEGFAYSIADKLLFSPGSNEISETGKKTLAKIASQIKEKSYPGVRIEGHTDTDPVLRTREKWPLGNHELAMARSLAVYGVLTTDGVDSKVLSLAAFGPNHPVATGNSDAAKAKNRRVEIHVAVPNKG